jgi:hypothetical protein
VPAATISRRTSLAVIFTCLALAVIAETTVRVVAPHLATPNLWNNWEATNKVKAMDALGPRGGASVVLVGSSMMNAAGDPAALSRLIGAKRPVFNAALAGMTARLLNFWTLRVVVPRLHPRMVVIGVSSRELNDLAKAGDFEAIRSSFEGRRLTNGLPPTQRVLTLGERYSYTVRYRSLLRTPSQWFTSEAERPLFQVGPLGQSARSISKLDRPYGVFEQRVRGSERVPAFNPYAVGGREITALRDLATSLAKADIRVLIVEMPVSPDLAGFHQHGADDYRRFEQAVAATAADEGLPLLNMSPSFPDRTTFVDTQHVNRIGRERFTRLLFDYLRSVFPAG